VIAYFEIPEVSENKMLNGIIEYKKDDRRKKK
jgi:hypothetical protein